MNAAKILLPILLLAGGTTAWYLLQSPEARPEGATKPKVDTPAEKPKDPAGPVAVETGSNPVPPPDRRVEVTGSDATNADAAQGVMGRVLLPNGEPGGAIPVYLMRSMASDPVGVWLANRAGTFVPPIARGSTGADGTFRLGISKFADEYELRVVSSDHPELSLHPIRVRQGDWYDAHDVKLEPGGVVQGRVTEEGTGAVITTATVYLTSTNQSHSLLAVPGREHGIAARVDGNGFYRFGNAPMKGSVVLIAEADGYARVEKNNLVLGQDGNVDFAIEMVRGLPIRGIVVDDKGAPISGVHVAATALSSKTPQTGQADSQKDGTFEVPALREGPYALVFSSPQYEEKNEKQVMAGRIDLRIELLTRGMAKLRVLSKQGAPVKAYQLQLKRHFPNTPQGIGNVPEFKDQRITPGDYSPEFGGEWALVRGLPNGEYVFQVTASGHAKTLSKAFAVAPGTMPEVEVQLTMGGELLGRVIDDRGNPVVGAKVSTDVNGGLAGDSEFFQLFRQFMPDRNTIASANTDAQGRYRLQLLALGEYMLRAQHGDYCDGRAVDLKLEGEGAVQVPDIVLARGTIVEGTVTVGGKPTGQVKVSIGPPASQTPMTDERGRPKMVFSASAISDSDGHFVFSQRVPPGNYQIHAVDQVGSNNPFTQILRMKQTQRDLTIGPGQDRLPQNFDLSAQ